MGKLIRFTSKGIYCPEADFFIDPWKPVGRALITHGHSDHARKGHSHYLCHTHSVNILKHRLGKGINVQGIKYGEVLSISGVKVSFFPAGHIHGSSQILVENNSEKWVISGDYNTSKDPHIIPFEPVKCDYFVTESTFGLPVFQWEEHEKVIEKINDWWRNNQTEKKTSMISAYSLGKAQRIIQSIDHSIGPVLTHPTVQQTNEVLIQSGIPLKHTELLEKQSKDILEKSMVICPPGAVDSQWSNEIKNKETAFASGWMAIRGTRRRRNLSKGFVLSDHADWNGLNWAVKETGAKKVFVTHGYAEIYSKWLRESGIESEIVKTEFEGESAD